MFAGSIDVGSPRHDPTSAIQVLGITMTTPIQLKHTTSLLINFNLT